MGSTWEASCVTFPSSSFPAPKTPINHGRRRVARSSRVYTCHAPTAVHAGTSHTEPFGTWHDGWTQNGLLQQGMVGLLAVPGSDRAHPATRSCLFMVERLRSHCAEPSRLEVRSCPAHVCEPAAHPIGPFGTADFNGIQTWCRELSDCSLAGGTHWLNWILAAGLSMCSRLAVSCISCAHGGHIS